MPLTGEMQCRKCRLCSSQPLFVLGLFRVVSSPDNTASGRAASGKIEAAEAADVVKILLALC